MAREKKTFENIFFKKLRCNMMGKLGYLLQHEKCFFT